MADHLRVGDKVKVDRPRSKRHGVEGTVDWIGLDQFKSTAATFEYAIRIEPGRVIVPYEYVRVWRDDTWQTPDPLDPPE